MALLDFFKKNKKEEDSQEVLSEIDESSDIDSQEDNVEIEEYPDSTEGSHLQVDGIEPPKLEDVCNTEDQTHELPENSDNSDNNDDSPQQESEQKMSFFKKIISGLDKTRKNIISGLENVLNNFKSIDEELFEELEEALIMADLGIETSTAIISSVRERIKKEKVTEVSQLKMLIIEEICNMLESDNDEFELPMPSVILVIGVNGVGKTTTIGKLTAHYKGEGRKILLAAGDTFRAAAIDQLEIWGNRSGVDTIKHQENSDPSAVIFDAIQAAKARKVDMLICDTAGRLHNKKNLMEELKKIFRTISTNYPEAKLEVLLVLDSTTGQNALQQAKIFKEVASITGTVLTKLDGTAKGGIVVAIKNELKIPVRFIGVGEGVQDLRPFNSSEFAQALFTSQESTDEENRPAQ